MPVFKPRARSKKNLIVIPVASSGAFERGKLDGRRHFGEEG